MQKLLSIGRLTVDSSTATIESDEGSCDAVKTCRRMTKNRSTVIESMIGIDQQGSKIGLTVCAKIGGTGVEDSH